MLGGLIGWIAVVAHADVVINEFEPNPAGSDGGLEWIELYNTGAAPVDLSGWSIEKATSSYSNAYTFGPGESIPAGGYIVVAGEFVAGATHYLAPGDTLSMGNASSSGDAIQLVDGLGIPVDVVVYGPDNSDGFLDESGFIATPAPSPPNGGSLARIPNGADTDDNAADFLVASVVTLGTSNDAATPSCDPVGNAPGMVINELVPDPAGADTDMEWVELYLPSGGPVDVSGWAVAAGTSSYSTQGTIPPGTTMSGGDYLVVAQSDLVADFDVVAAGFSLGNASNADAVQLRDCFGNPVDTVVYGTDNSDAWLDDLGGIASLAPPPGSGDALQRIPDGADSNNSQADFQVGFPTPGGSNTAPPPDCGAIGSGIVINELLTNPPGPDEGSEWIEVFHAGVAPVDVSGWTVQSATSESWSTRLTFDPGTTLLPGELLLLGGPNVPGSTLGLSGTLGNGSGGDGVRIADCNGIPADVVVYGGLNEDGITDESGQPALSVAPTPPEGLSIQRVQDGFDTDQSGLDFAVADVPSPGQPNPALEPIVCEPDAGVLRINEIMPDPDGTDDGLEYIEIYNTGTAPARLDGWSISAGTSDYDDLDITFPGGIVVQPGEFFVVGGEFVAEATYVTSFSLGNASGNRDGVRLFDCTGESVDTVVYGQVDPEDPDVGIVDDNDVLVEPYGDPGSNQALFRVEDGVDTDTAEDWQVGRATPGETNEFDTSGTSGDDPLGGCGCGNRGAPDGQAPNPDAPSNPAPNGSCSTVTAVLAQQGWVLGMALLLVGLRRRA
jgi:hypothetical protein